MTDVVITGLGATTPLGGDVESSWKALLAGASGVHELTDLVYAEIPCRIAAPFADSPTDHLERAKARRLDRSQQAALVAAKEAWASAGSPEVDPERLAVVVGTGVGGAVTLLAQDDIREERGPKRVSPYMVPMLMPNGPAATVGLELGAKAGVHTTVSACASGAEALQVAMDLIRCGRADVVVAGGAEACIHPTPFAGFGMARAMSTRNDDPTGASRPFDTARDGFVMGEGAALMVLESAEHAAARGATVIARLAGAGTTSDAYDMVAPDPGGSGAARAITLALRDGGLEPTDVHHVNAHATSTPVGDIAEAAAIRAAIGDHAAVTATKGATGHMMGASGAVEALFTILAIRDQVSPHILNLTDVDPDPNVQALDLVREAPREMRIDAAISDSFGFGGHNTALLFTRP
ncbi:beta-ketoacyl-[acyl-carrier-protein] synthase family protein [Cumulibacter manganitolerans]|uniref:beta-ketoacyl-[acyl-carrier-protein] synthase family protein n=1 Tax=Cumulibacter manganitolerans TaxID=1884992 RepID=UPI00129562CB|nr:beta-ketoacyl-[acyl-carrier-protein] synthase family protein [Cumulibacter manganitolerans]